MQTLLNLRHTPSYAPQDFILGTANEEAHAWLHAWPTSWTAPSAILWGEEGCGKTHLAHIWKHLAHAEFLCPTTLSHDLEHLFTSSANATHKAWILEDVTSHLSAQHFSEEDLFHLLNICQQHHNYLLMTAYTPASQWNLSLKDVSSRLHALPSIAISLPDDELLKAVLIKLFSDRQLHISDEVMHYILLRIDRNFQHLERLCDTIDRLSLQTKRKINITLVKEILHTTYTFC
jgi:DnaA regulatory inactivator Hda